LVTGVAAHLTGIPGLPQSGFFTGPVLLLLVLHILAGMTAVLTGVLAAAAPKRAGPHPLAGKAYLSALLVLAAAGLVLAGVRGRADLPLAVLGLLAAGVGLYGRSQAPSRGNHVRRHIVAMGGSFVLILTAFYVDNGPLLPLWQHLPTVVFWLGPSFAGAPIVVRALRRPRPDLYQQSP
jgi:hypothetical protein